MALLYLLAAALPDETGLRALSLKEA
jgi:hypothetical protein